MRSTTTETLPVSCEEAFDLTHDYSRRLAWDTLLSAAYLEGGATAAGRGVAATCKGRGLLSPFALTTVYVSFDRPEVAAVKLVNEPPLFATWAASIRHAPAEGGGSTLTYTLHFTARPRWLAWLLEPVIGWLFTRETRKRLAAMRAYFEARRTTP